jgi:3-hydroxyisobutyrate dehydrogenase
MANIAFLGLGKMGSGMAGRLISTGHQVSVWNRSPAKADSLIEKGAHLCATPAQAAQRADAIFAMVADDEASIRVWLADDGALTSAASGAVALECSTLSHGHVMRLAREARSRGITYIDCPVNGPPTAAAAGQLTLLVGAATDDLTKARPFLTPLASSILHFGAVGTGTAFKLMNNLLGAVHISALAEVVALAERLGLDHETLITAVDCGPCASPHVKRLIRPMVEGRVPPVPVLTIGLREKDARYCLALANESQCGMAIGTVAHAWYTAAKPLHAAEDDSALIKTVAERAGKI